MSSNDDEIRKTQEERKKMEHELASLAALNAVTFDTELYGASDRSSYLTSVPASEDAENIEADNEF
ncbi:splicing factor 3B subunit 1-like, partial [Trifolium medium]|nr:splicing factor 3B subunit 1-like [Trifolium medium]